MDFAVVKNILQFFEDSTNTFLAEHFLVTASVCSWFINVRTALFLKQKNTLRHNEKANLSNC